MAEGRGGGLSKGRAERAGSIGSRGRIDAQLRVAGRGEVTQLMIDRPLLRRQQQQQEAQCLVQLTRSVE